MLFHKRRHTHALLSPTHVTLVLGEGRCSLFLGPYTGGLVSESYGQGTFHRPQPPFWKCLCLQERGRYLKIGTLRCSFSSVTCLPFPRASTLRLESRCSLHEKRGLLRAPFKTHGFLGDRHGALPMCTRKLWATLISSDIMGFVEERRVPLECCRIAFAIWPFPHAVPHTLG